MENLEIDLNQESTTLTLKFPLDLDPQDLELYFDFVADLNTKMQGFSRYFYTCFN